MSILRNILGVYLLLGFLSSTSAWAAGPFSYRLPRAPGWTARR